MKGYFVDSRFENSPDALRRVLRAQSTVRLCFALSVAAVGYVIYWLSPHHEPYFASATTLFCFLYSLGMFVTVRRGGTRVLSIILIATAIADPLVLSATVVLAGIYGSLVVGFYIFTMLGFGFRAGPRLMFVCQAAAIAGFIAIFAMQSFWQEHWIMWLSWLTPMLAVPLYAANLLHTLRAAHEAVDQARALAEQQSRGKSELLAKVSHELRTPLSGIVTATELLDEEVRDPRVERRTRTIRSLTDSLLSEINDLLDQAKFDSNKASLTLGRIDLAAHVHDSLRMFEGMAQKKGIVFAVHVDPTMVDDVSSDSHLIERVLHNLVGNAIKFTHAGRVDVSVQLAAETAEQYRVYFTVTDTGIGIPDAFRERMFEAFAQADSGSERRYGGTGLGLALSRSTVTLLGGDLQYSSAVGKGTRFWFELTLPRLPVEDNDGSEIEDDSYPVGKRILLAEDNHTNLMLLKELLEIDDHIITSCTSGLDALELLAKQAFDVLLLDYNLGDMDGVRVLQTYKFATLHPSPVIFLTADATPATATRLYEAGSAAILYKPVSLAQIRDALKRIELDVADVPSVASVDAIGEVSPTRSGPPALSVVPTMALDARTLKNLKQVSKRPEFVPELLASAELDIGRSCQLLQDALAGKTHVNFRDVAHALKGVCINVGAMRLVALASNLMRMSSDEIEQASPRIAMDLRQAHAVTVQALHTAIAESTPLAAKGGMLHADQHVHDA